MCLPISRAVAAHPLALEGVWRADRLPLAPGVAWSTGHPPLDAQLPGQGWPVGGLVEVLQPTAAHHEWQLVLPALALWQRHAPGPGLPPRAGVVLVGPPHTAFTPALAGHGLHTAALLAVQADDPAQRLWACEQALQCPDVGAVLAWLPHAPMAAWRRLQLAVARLGGLLWVFRPLAVSHQASPAVLRLAVQADPAGQGLQVRVLKRRGPVLSTPVVLPLTGGALSATLAAARWRNRLRQAGVRPLATEVPHDTVSVVAGIGPRPIHRATPV